MAQPIKIKHLVDRLGSSPRHLIGRISFEERSLVVPRILADLCSSSLIFVSARRSEIANANLRIFRDLFPHAIIVELDTSNPIQTAEQMFEKIHQAVQTTGLQDTLIDISSFRREELLMLLAILKLTDVQKDTGCELIYVGAARMADWMSKNIKEYRSVIGYAGEMLPSRKTRLVVLMGFEVDRARGIIENYEPAEVVLGMGRRSESINDELFNLNESFFNELRLRSDNVKHTFEFSARDPIKVAAELEEAIGSEGDLNVVIAPLNTKLSTLGAGLYAQRHKEVQICYAAVAEYNEKAYSTPGADAFVISLRDLL